jgi:hypothetical protein
MLCELKTVDIQHVHDWNCFCVTWLENLLAAGPMDSIDVFDAAKSQGIARDRIWQSFWWAVAKGTIGAHQYQGRWIWERKK